MLLGRLAIDDALPALAWTALNGSEWDSRVRATAILAGIAAKDDEYGIHYHKLSTHWEYANSDLGWLVGLLSFRHGI